MKVDGGLGTIGGALGDVAGRARRLEELGYSGGMTAEVNHDPFLPLALASQATTSLDLLTGIAVAFARNPMTLANVAHDLQLMSQGRFILGLGSQIKPHITKRFSMPWSQPAARMRELILAMRAIWATWNTGEPLRFKGDFYTHTLMTPMFHPGASQWGPPKVFLAGVGPVMTEVAGEVADGFIAHAFTTPSYFHAHTLPGLQRGLERAGRPRADIEVSIPIFMVIGRDDAEIRTRAVATRQQIAFYGSTPAYKPVLDHHGWGDLSGELNRLSKQGEWVKMADVIDDAVLNEFAIVGSAHDVAAQVKARYGGSIDRLMFFYEGGDDLAPQLLAELKAI